MFAKDKISQSMIDAVSSVMNEAEKTEDSKPTGKKPDWLLAAELKAEKKTGKLKESEKLDEIDANAILGMAKKITPNARIVTADQKKKEREELDAKRSKEAEGKPKSTGYVSAQAVDFGKNKGYGQGRYMGDSVETNGKLVENKDQRFIDAVSKVINGGKGVTVEEEVLGEKDELRGRIGTNIVNKKPREGQTDLRNIPAGNRPDGKNKFSQGERDSQPTRLKNDIKASLGKHTKPNLPEEVEQMDEVEDAFTAYKNKRPSELGRHLTRKHDAKRLSDTSVMYTKKHGKDLESAKDAGDAHNASVYAKQKMRKEENENEGLVAEATMTYNHDKQGKKTGFKYEGDWVKKTANKEGRGKVTNMAGRGMQKAKELAKEDAQSYTNDNDKPKTTDTLAGRIKVPKKFDNQHISRKVELKAEESHPDAAEDKKLIAKMIKKDDEREEKKDKKNDITLIKKVLHKEMTEFEHIHGEHLKVHTGPHKGREGTLNDIHGHIFEIKPHGAKSHKDHIYVPQNHTTIVHQTNEDKKVLHKEMTEFEHIHGEHLKVHSGPHKSKEGTLHDIHGDIFEIKPHGAKSEKDHIYVPQNHTTIVHQNNESFHGPEAGSGTGDSPMATNDSKPVKLAKYLAVKTVSKMKNEMLGKMTN